MVGQPWDDAGTSRISSSRLRAGSGVLGEQAERWGSAKTVGKEENEGFFAGRLPEVRGGRGRVEKGWILAGRKGGAF